MSFLVPLDRVGSLSRGGVSEARLSPMSGSLLVGKLTAMHPLERRNIKGVSIVGRDVGGFFVSFSCSLQRVVYRTQ